jgi:hypothetical protein
MGLKPNGDRLTKEYADLAAATMGPYKGELWYSSRAMILCPSCCVHPRVSGRARLTYVFDFL